MTASRRQYLALLATGTTLGFAGCTSEEEGPVFLVTNTDYREIGEDIEVRVTIENSSAGGQEAPLEIVITHPDVDDEWRKEKQVSLPSATELQPRYVFEGIHEEGRDVNDYDVEAQLLKE